MNIDPYAEFDSILPITQHSPKRKETQGNEAPRKNAKEIRKIGKMPKWFHSPEDVYKINNKSIPCHFQYPSTKQKNSTSQQKQNAENQESLFVKTRQSSLESVKEKIKSYSQPQKNQFINSQTKKNYSANKYKQSSFEKKHPQFWGCIVPKHIQKLNKKKFEHLYSTNWNTQTQFSKDEKRKDMLHNPNSSEQHGSSQNLLTHYVTRKFKKSKKQPVTYDVNGRSFYNNTKPSLRPLSQPKKYLLYKDLQRFADLTPEEIQIAFHLGQTKFIKQIKKFKQRHYQNMTEITPEYLHKLKQQFIPYNNEANQQVKHNKNVPTTQLTQSDFNSINHSQPQNHPQSNPFYPHHVMTHNKTESQNSLTAFVDLGHDQFIPNANQYKSNFQVRNPRKLNKSEEDHHAEHRKTDESQNNVMRYQNTQNIHAYSKIKKLNDLIKWRSKVIQKIQDSMHEIKYKNQY